MKPTGNILIGAAIGLVAGILLAPDKGSVTLRNAKNNLKGFGEDLTGSVNNMNEMVKPYVGKLKNFVNKNQTASQQEQNQNANTAQTSVGTL